MTAEVMNDFLEEDTQKGKYLTFVIGKEAYGISIENVIEIIGILPITEVPELPNYIRGIVNLRGQIIPVMDVRLRFKMALAEYDERTCIIVISIQDNSVGLIVDSISEVITILDDNIVDQPILSIGASNSYIKNIGKVGNEVIMLIDSEKLLNQSEIEMLSEMAE